MKETCLQCNKDFEVVELSEYEASSTINKKLYYCVCPHCGLRIIVSADDARFFKKEKE